MPTHSEAKILQPHNAVARAIPTQIGFPRIIHCPYPCRHEKYRRKSKALFPKTNRNTGSADSPLVLIRKSKALFPKQLGTQAPLTSLISVKSSKALFPKTRNTGSSDSYPKLLGKVQALFPKQLGTRAPLTPPEYQNIPWEYREHASNLRQNLHNQHGATKPGQSNPQMGTRIFHSPIPVESISSINPRRKYWDGVHSLISQNREGYRQTINPQVAQPHNGLTSYPVGRVFKTHHKTPVNRTQYILKLYSTKFIQQKVYSSNFIKRIPAPKTPRLAA